MKKAFIRSIAGTLIFWGGISAFAGSWTPLANQPTFLNPVSQCKKYPNTNCAPLNKGNPACLSKNRSWGISCGYPNNLTLMTDGSVLVEAVAATDDGKGAFNFRFVEYKLIPDSFGNYVTGHWKQVASLPNAATSANPNGYGPAAFASAVLPDGRVIYEGGEINGINSNYVWTALGAIYDPVADQWAPVTPPHFLLDNPVYGDTLPNIGDAASVVLANGTFMLQNCCNFNSALLNAKTMTWTETGFNKFDGNNEEGWTLLPNGKVLTIDTYTLSYDPLGYYGRARNGYPNVPYPADPTNSEIYDPATGLWSSAGSTIVRLNDEPTREVGPAILMADGRVWATGSTGNTALYNYSTNTWTVGPTFPVINGLQVSPTDNTASLLTNENVLVGASFYDPVDIGVPPLRFYEYDGVNLVAQPDVPNASRVIFANLLVLPNGQILMNDGGASTDMEIYTPSNRYKTGVKPAYAPIILSAPTSVIRGKSYSLKGKNLNGVSQGTNQGDDYQAATNFPLVRITNFATGHVFYCRTHDFDSMAVASSLPSNTKFDVPANQELGASKLEVVTNGIPSDPINITVKAH